MTDRHVAEVITLRPDSRPINWTGPIFESHSTRGSLLKILFDVSTPLTCGGSSRLHSIWAAEAMNRAKNMCQLAMLLEHHRWNGSQHFVGYRTELACASQLASCLRSLDFKNEETMLPCAELMCQVSSCVVTLFRPALGQLTLKAACERINLSADRRRALILAAMELVTQTLFNAFDRQSEGIVSVSLTYHRSERGTLRIEDNGRGLEFEARMGRQVLADLVSVLDADIAHDRSPMGGTATRINFTV